MGITIAQIGSDIDGTYSSSYTYTVPSYSRGVLVCATGIDSDIPATPSWNGDAFTSQAYTGSGTSGVRLSTLVSPDAGEHSLSIGNTGNWHGLILLKNVDISNLIVATFTDRHDDQVYHEEDTVDGGILVGAIDARFGRNNWSENSDEQILFESSNGQMGYILPVDTPTDLYRIDNNTEEMAFALISIRPVEVIPTQAVMLGSNF